MIRTCWAAVLLIGCNFDSSAGAGGGGFLGMGETTGDVSESSPETAGEEAQDGTDSLSAEGSGDSATTLPPPPTCMQDGVCVPAAPAGWTGPLALGTWGQGGASLSCPEAWPAATEGNIGLAVGDPACGCSCTKVDGECEAAVSYYRDDSCGTADASTSSSGECASLGSGATHSTLRVTPSANGSSCTPNPTRQIAPVAWDQHALACSPAPLGDCDDGLCMPGAPPGFGNRYCIMLAGDEDCPAGPYALRTVVYGGVEDSRDCTSCTCGMTDPACGGTLTEYYTAFVCTGNAGSITADGTCRISHLPDEDAWSVRYNAPVPAFSCMPTDSSPTGTVNGTDPVTFCCNG